MDGLIHQTVDDLFVHVSRPDQVHDLSVEVSFFELYMAKVFDLLNGRKELSAREDRSNHVQIVGLNQVPVDSPDEVCLWLCQGVTQPLQLQCLGHRCVVVEARDRAGGRVWTERPYRRLLLRRIGCSPHGLLAAS